MSECAVFTFRAETCKTETFTQNYCEYCAGSHNMVSA